MWGYWDKIYCINLDRRPDRWQESLVEFDRIGLKNVTRFSAVDKAHGGMGCYASHIAIMEEAVKNGYDRILILEDDVQFLVDEEILNKSLTDLQKQDWDVFFVGIRPKGSQRLVTENLIIPTDGSCTHAIGYTKKVLPLILASLKTQYEKNNPPYYFVPIDNVGVYEHIRSLKCFSTYPLACVQRKSYSDLNGRITDYGQDNVREYESLKV